MKRAMDRPYHIRAVLFDKDGTLLDYQRNWGPLNRRAALLAADGDAVLAARLLAIGGMDDASGITAADSLLAAGNSDEIATAWCAAGARLPKAELTERLDALFTAAADRSIPVTDLAGLYRRLAAAGLRLGIASSDSAAAIVRFAERCGITPWLDFIAGYDSGFGVKPEPGMLTAFSRAIDIPAAQIAMVGDNLHDMNMAKAAGAGLRIAVLSGTGTRDGLSPACDLCLETIDGLERALGLEGK